MQIFTRKHSNSMHNTCFSGFGAGVGYPGEKDILVDGVSMGRVSLPGRDRGTEIAYCENEHRTRDILTPERT